jgi:hypothetical protein
MGPAKAKEDDRRKKARFPICREMRFKLMEDGEIVAEGTGATIDIASGGVSFISGQPLKVGTYAEISISWPVLLDDDTRMRLVVFGRVVRSNIHTTACTVDKYEFRTQARKVGAVAQTRRDGMLRRWVEELRLRDMLKARGAIA